MMISHWFKKILIEKDEIEPTQKVVEDTLTVNLATKEDPQEVQIGSTLNQSECK